MEAMKNFKLVCLSALFWTVPFLLSSADQGCTSCGNEAKLRLQLRGIAKLSGNVTVEIYVGQQRVDSFVLTGAPAGSDTYNCVEWPRNVTVEPKFDQPVLISYIYDPDQTEFDPDAVFDNIQANPVVFYRKPSAHCVKYCLDAKDNNWMEETQAAFFSQSDGLRIKVVPKNCHATVGQSTGPSAGVEKPACVVPEFTDSEPWPSIIDKCPAEGAAAAAMMVQTAETTASSRKTGGEARARPSVKGSYSEFKPANDRKVDAGQTTLSSSSDQAATSSVLSASATPYSLTRQIGSLTWEMSLGSLQRSQSLGRLIYSAEVLDANSLSPARISLAEGSDPVLILRDAQDNLRQIEMTDHLVDLTQSGGELLISVFAASQIAGFNDGVYLTSGAPILTWAITSPDGLGSIRFTKSEGSGTEVHTASWQGTAGVSGVMTISRFGGKWKEERTYALAGGGTQRIETVAQYKNNVLQHKVREVYQQFNNWGQPGEVFEAMVQKVEDPDGQALITTFEYWDTTALPGNLLFRATYPDGFQQWMPTRVGLGGGSPPVYSDGELLRSVETYKDQAPASGVGRMTYTENVFVSATNLIQKTTTTINGSQVGYREIHHDFSTGYWVQQIYSLADESGQFTYKEKWLNASTKEPLFILETDGTSKDYFYSLGYWDTAAQTFGAVSGSGRIRAKRITITHGTTQATGGIANRTLIDRIIVDQFGRTLVQESYVNTGGGVTEANLLDRQIHTYADGLRTSTTANGRRVFEAGYDSDGLVQWEEGASGQRTEYTYDELHRVAQKTVRGRGGDADKVTTYDYDVFGNVVSEQTSAGGLVISTLSHYNIAGELDSTTGSDGLVTSVNTSYAGGFKVITETLPTQATRVTSYFKDRQMRSMTGTAVEDMYFNPFLGLWTATSYREAVSAYRDSAFTLLKQTRLVNWLGNEILVQTRQFKGVGNRNRFTTYDVDGNGVTRQLPAKIEETGRVRQIIGYNSLAQKTSQALDFDNNGSSGAASMDRVTTFDQNYENSGDSWENVVTVQRQLTDGVDAPVLFQRSRTKVPAGLAGELISSGTTEKAGGGLVIETTTLNRNTGVLTTIRDDQELGQIHTRVERDGLPRSQTDLGIAGAKTWTYTALGETETATEPVTGTVTYTYDPSTRRLASTVDQANRQTLYSYYPAGTVNAGMLKGTRDADHNWTYFDYTSSGQLLRKWGVNSYPAEFQYNEAGDRTQMKTFRTRPGDVDWSSSTWPNPPGGDVTQWVYDVPSGLLERKVYADAKAVVYSYDSGNYVDNKTNARGQVVDYTCDGAGQVTGITYSEGTPSVSFSYDRAGRSKTVSDGSGACSLSWNLRDQLEDEVYSAGSLAGIEVHRGYDAKFRLEVTEFRQGGLVSLRQKTAYDAISRIDYIADESGNGSAELNRFDYTFKAGTPFVQSIDFSRGSNPVMTQSYVFDALGRLAGAGAALTGGAPLRSVSYQFDNLDRRQQADWNDGAFWDYDYNPRGEVTSAKKKFNSQIFVGGSQFEYGFDDIGNRTLERSGGDAGGANLRETTYGVANALNQETSRNPIGSIFIIGEAPVTLSLQGFVDQQSFSLTRQQDETFFGEAQVNNQAWPVYAKLKVVGKNAGAVEDVQSGFRFIARTPETFGYDADGNLANDGRWSYSWDAENRLVQMETLPDAVSAGAPKQRLNFAYDSGNRRYRSQLYTWNSGNGSYQLTKLTHFVYDGSNVLAELDQALNPVRLYQWGLDLSGARQGVGGVGGLLAMKVPATGKCFYYTMDGNGNVQQIVNSETATAEGEYEYSPSGQIIRSTGQVAADNPFRFSTKYQDAETDLYYYGFRFYDASSGRWLNRDLIGENGGANLYQAFLNDPVNKLDFIGMEERKPWTVYFEEWKKMHNWEAFSEKQKIWIENQLSKGCVGVVIISLGSAPFGAQAGFEFKTGYPARDRCFWADAKGDKSQARAMAEAEKAKCACPGGIDPSLYSIHLTAKDQSTGKMDPTIVFKPDGRVDLSMWRKSPASLGGGHPFDYGFLMKDGRIIGAEHDYNPPDPNDPTVGKYRKANPSTKEPDIIIRDPSEWHVPATPERGRYDTEVWCVACGGGDYGGK